MTIIRCKGVDGKIVCLCTRSDENLFMYKNFMFIGAMVSQFHVFKRKICFPVFPTLCDILHAVTFLHVLHLEDR